MPMIDALQLLASISDEQQGLNNHIPNLMHTAHRFLLDRSNFHVSLPSSRLERTAEMYQIRC